MLTYFLYRANDPITMLDRGASSGDVGWRSRVRRLRASLVSSHSGGLGAPPGWPLRAACQELADDPGECPDESAARGRKIAAVERREARRPVSLAGDPWRSRD